MKRFPLGFLAVLVMLSLGTSIGSAVTTKVTENRQHASQVEVVGATAVCPDLRQAKDLLATRVSVGSGPLPVGRTSSGGSIEAHKVSTPGTSVDVRVQKSGQVAVNLGTGTTKDGLEVSATGDLAAALEVEQVTRGEGGLNRGLAGLRCEPPRRDLWFEGGSTMIYNDSRLVLVNVDDTTATVNLALFSSKGPVAAPGGEGLSIPGHTRLQIELDTLAPDRDLLALHVVATRGRVAAGLLHSTKTLAATEGVDWVPQTQPPATSVVVPGFFGGRGKRTLYVTNPGADPTTVTVKLTTQFSQFVPTGGFDSVAVPAGTTVPIELSGQTGAGCAPSDDGSTVFTPAPGCSSLSATVTSDGAPIIAGGFEKDYQTGAVREFSYTAGSPPLSGPALLTDVVINRPTESTLILTAPQQSATVIVTPIQVLGQTGALPGPKTVKIPAGRTATLALSTFFRPGANAQLAVEVRPVSGSGPVYAARYLRERGAHGPLTTVLDLEGPAQLVNHPAVQSDPQVATP